MLYLFGGKALKNTETRRIDRREFDNLCLAIIPRLEKYFQNVSVPLFYRNKESFGDIDFVCASYNSSDVINNVHKVPIVSMKDMIMNEFHPNEIYHNGNCWSFDFQGVQIDLITTSAENFLIYSVYLSYNDLGNMMGKLAHQLGFKYGEHGLWYNYYKDGKKLGELEISKDPVKIFDFLGLDHKRYLQGFDELIDIFEYVYSSKYFDWRGFQLENLNHVNRSRDVKRASYWSLLEWIEKQPKKEFEFIGDEIYLQEAIKAFPEANIMLQIKEMEYNEAKRAYTHEKFNGDMVRAKYGLEGKELGEAIKNFKDNLGVLNNDEFIDYLINTPIKLIWDTFELSRKLSERKGSVL